MEKRVFKQLMRSLQQALEHVRGERELRSYIVTKNGTRRTTATTRPRRQRRRQ
jgi:hypothetical protein